MVYVSEIEIDYKDFNRINQLMKVEFSDINKDGKYSQEMGKLIAELDAQPNAMPYSFCFEFEDKSQIYIDICSGDNNYYDNCQWVSEDKKRDHLFDCKYHIVESEEFVVGDTTYICKFIIKGK